MVYIPSAVATLMDFRCGVIGSLQDQQFPVHRYALDQTTILYGAAFWGALFSCVILWGLTGTVAFVAVWEVCCDVTNVVHICSEGDILTIFHVVCGDSCHAYTLTHAGGASLGPSGVGDHYRLSHDVTVEITHFTNLA